jgi:hypothetical protein
MFADENGWNVLDLTAADTPLAAGDYAGAVRQVEMISRPDALWVKVSFVLDGHDYEPPPLMATLAAKPGSAYAPRVTEGVRALNQLSEAVGVALPSNMRPSDLPKLLVGRPLTLRCATKKRDGVLELVVRKVLPPVSSGDDKSVL